MKKGFLIVLIFLFSVLSFQSEASRRRQPPIDFLAYAQKIADAEIARNPSALQTDWNHDMAFRNMALLRLYEATENEKYLNYVREVADNFLDEQGLISALDTEAFDLRNVLGGNFLYGIFYHSRGEIRYSNAMYVVRRQMFRQPRAGNRLFWFSQAYENQVWLEGIFMALPFYCLYAAIFDQPAVFGDVALQIRRIDIRTLDETTGLNFQAWDESRTRVWANEETGTTQTLFGQSIGFYLMGLVDVLDFFPISHHFRFDIIQKINRITRGLARFQDSHTGMWYEVLDQPRDRRNFIDASSTAMFAYAIAKAVNNGFLPPRDRQIAERAFRGLIDNALESSDITRATANANPNDGDGTIDYYVNLPQPINEPNAVAAFILAAVELAR